MFKSFILSLFVFFNYLCASDSLDFIKELDKSKNQNIITYGTSLSCGPWISMFNEWLNLKYPGQITLINSAMPAMYSGWGVENLEERVLNKSPDVVFIEFSINDAYLPYNTSMEMSKHNIENMIDRILTRNPECQIILMTMNLPIREHLQARPYIDYYYQVYRDVARERNLLLIDHYLNWSNILHSDPKLYDKYVPDGIHPGEEGCKNVILPQMIKSLNEIS